MPWLHPIPSTLLLATCLAVGPSCAGAPEDPSDEDLDTALALSDPSADDVAARADCAGHPLAGTAVALSGRAHDVAGTLTIVDGCTLAVDDFRFDGGGIDVRALVAPTIEALGDDDDRHVLSEDLRRSGGYDGARLVFPLPAGVTVDDVGAFSIWCVPFGASFGDAVF